MMAGVDQIRDVIAFPKTQRGQDLLIDTPTPVTEQQLRDLHIRVRPTRCRSKRRLSCSRLPAPVMANRAPRSCFAAAALVLAAAPARLDRARARTPAASCPTSPRADLPKEAREVLVLIRARAVRSAIDRDGIVFGNREQILPPEPRGYYHEYTVPTPGVENPRRAAHRLRRAAKSPDAC